MSSAGRGAVRYAAWGTRRRLGAACSVELASAARLVPLLPPAKPTRPTLHVLPTVLCRREMDMNYWVANHTTPATALSSLTPALDKLPRLRRLGMTLALTGTLPAEWAAPNSLLR